jgi:two-component system chemotaxis sensor kinase CheA
MIEDLNDPLVHCAERGYHASALNNERFGQTEQDIAAQCASGGDHILITIADDGRGMNPEVLRNKAVQKGLITAEEASALSEEQSLNLVFMPGFSTKDEISSVSGRGVGMDVVHTNIQKLNGTIEIQSVPGKGSTFIIFLPLTLAILPVLLVRLNDQPFAVPLSMVREIMSVEAEGQQLISGKPTMIVRGEVLPVLSLAKWLGGIGKIEVGVLMQMKL